MRRVAARPRPRPGSCPAVRFAGFPGGSAVRRDPAGDRPSLPRWRNPRRARVHSCRASCPVEAASAGLRQRSGPPGSVAARRRSPRRHPRSAAGPASRLERRWPRWLPAATRRAPGHLHAFTRTQRDERAELAAAQVGRDLTANTRDQQRQGGTAPVQSIDGGASADPQRHRLAVPDRAGQPTDVYARRQEAPDGRCRQERGGERDG